MVIAAILDNKLEFEAQFNSWGSEGSFLILGPSEPRESDLLKLCRYLVNQFNC